MATTKQSNHGGALLIAAAAAAAAYYWREPIEAFLRTKIDPAAASLIQTCTSNAPSTATVQPAALQGIYREAARAQKTIWVSPTGRRNPRQVWMR